MAFVIVQILIFASLVLSVYMIVVTLERCRSEKRYGFVYCVVAIFLYTLGYFIEITCGTLGGAIIAIKVMYAGGCFMSPFFFFFVADYCEVRLPKKFYKIPLLIIPVLFYLAVLTFDSHQYMYEGFYYNTDNPILGMTIEPGPLYLVGTFYPLFCISLTCIVLVRSIIAQSRGRRFGLVLLLVSSLAPLIANFAYVAISFFFKTALAGINLTAFVMVISNFIFFYNVIRNDLFDLAPKALAITMDLIRDAFVVLDRGMAYTGSNKKAYELFPALSGLHKGASIFGLEGWPGELLDGLNSAAEKPENSSDPQSSLTASPDSARDEIEFTLPHRPGKIYSGWKNHVASESGATLGWVILIQDITETVSLIRNIRSQRDEIAAMRDNLKEGIFLMDREYKIQESYSKALEQVLSGKKLRGMRFTDLLVKSFNSKDLEIIADYFKMIIERSVDPAMLEDINPLMEFAYISTETGEHKTLRCLFAAVDQGNGEVYAMGTIQDITAETILKKQLAEEEEGRQDEMRSLFEVMQMDPKVFGDFSEDTEYEFGRIREAFLDKKLSNRQKIINIYQSVHAIKSNALITGLLSYGNKLHALETEIKALREKEEEPDSGDLFLIKQELEKRLQDKDKLSDILKRLSDFSVSGAAAARKEDEVFLESLKQACQRVAGDEQKKAVLTAERLDKEALSKGPRRIMRDILTQLVRNSVHHGIESPEDRMDLGKSATGKISLSVTLNDNAIRMVLSDDGRGLDFDRIAETALKRGLLKDPAKDKTNQQLLINLIFSPGFSTSETEDIHAGRGIGLSLVRDRLKEIKGQMKIQNKKGQGLVFDMRIPL